MYIKLLFSIIYFLVVFLAPSNSFSKNTLEYNIIFNNKPIGRLIIMIHEDRYDQKLDLVGEILDSPLGLYDGTYNISSKFYRIKGNIKTTFEHRKKTLFKSRSTFMATDNGKLVDIKIIPESAKTSLSSTSIEIAKFHNPAQALLKILHFPCSKTFQVFDGRRTVKISPIKSKNELECRYLYRVREGPGHLIPINLKNFDLQVKRMNKNDDIGSYLSFGSFLSKVYLVSSELE